MQKCCAALDARNLRVRILAPEWRRTELGAGSKERGVKLQSPCSLLRAPRLLPYLQTPQQIKILLGIDPLHVIQQAASPTDHSQQPTPTGVVFGVQLQMIGHLGDAIGEQRNLDFWGARIGLPASKFTLQLLFPFFRKWH